MQANAAKIRDLAIIGDRRTAAIIGADGNIVWYCPQRFDAPSILGALLDPNGGIWRIDFPRAAPLRRRYVEDSAVLETCLRAPSGDLTVTDWMPIGDSVPHGMICRRLTSAPDQIRVSLEPRPDYARRVAIIRRKEQAIVIDDSLYFYTSHPATIDARGIHLMLERGEDCWVVLSDLPLTTPQNCDLDQWLAATLAHWRQLASRTSYNGPYQRETQNSLRALRLLTYEPSGAILAAATTSLPEVAGGKRNYDYRYAWLRDAAMMVRAFIHVEGEGTQERRFLEFIHGSQRNSPLPLAPAATVSCEVMPEQTSLSLEGYCASRPVLIGNQARLQLQMSAYGNVLLAARLIYETYQTREHWEVVRTIADFLVEHWREPDNGIWEEAEKRHYTVSKVIAASGLEAIAIFAADPEQGERWREAARKIRHYVSNNCLTHEGAYAAVAGGETVDVSATLFPVWNYTSPDSAEMVATMAALERDFASNHLYRRYLESFDSQQEGAFLAGTFWVARCWILRGDLERARRILDAGLAYANDLGLFAEEADTASGDMLGNFPQGFVHAAFINAVVDLKDKLDGTSGKD